jgi:hypothetical protein
MTEDEIINEALDIYARIGIGQLTPIIDLLNRMYPKESYWPADPIFQEIEVLQKRLHCNGFGIRNPNVSDRSLAAFELLQKRTGK